jgi:hypothetical protein
MDGAGTPARTEDEIDELLLELGLQYVGITQEASGELFMRFRFVDRDKNMQADVSVIGKQAIALLSSTKSKAVLELWQSARGIIIE